MSTAGILFFLFSYIIIVLIAYYYNNPFFSDSISNSDLINSYASPIVSKKNITKVTKERFQSINNDYIKVLQDKQWKLLRKSTNITIETLQSSSDNDGWPFYIKTTAHLNKKPKDLFNYFKWNQFDNTQKKTDPFYDKASLLLDINKEIKLIRKTTKKVFILPKREFILALTDSSQNKDIKIAITNQLYSPIHNATELVIKKGTQLQSWASLTLNEDYIDLPKLDDSKYIRAYQDFIAWFVDDNKNGTYLIIVMRVDLGSDIPRWLFTTTVAGTGIWSMQSLIKYIKTNEV